MAHDVPDHQQGTAEVEPYRLEPVAADESPGAQRQVAAGHLQVRMRPAGLGDQRPLEVERDPLGGREAACVPDVRAREARREVQGRRLVGAEGGLCAGREELSVDLAPAGQRYGDDVRGSGRAGREVRVVQEAGRVARGGHAAAAGLPAAAGQLHGRRVAQSAGQESRQLPPDRPFVGGRPDPPDGLVHGAQPRLQAVPVRHHRPVSRTG
ncbi:hypothetical protein ACFVZN_25685 [Streptomyces virginiae]|uniref:hypothetical protein n=1 Tax=Streptomyces virginiae TaxID=1961 RepID=UPI00369686FB